MKGFPVLLATLLVSGALAFAQVCPPGMMMGTGVSSVPTIVYPVGTQLPAGTQPTAVTGNVVSPLCPNTMVSRDTACILNQMAMVQGQILASQLTIQGQMLTTRMNALISQEMQFRQALAANPNLPNAQLTALQLSAEAEALNRDIAAFNTTLSMVPAAQRPFVAQQMNTFDVAYWQPTVQRFNTYTAALPQATTIYQPAFAVNPWLQPWITGYQANVMALQQTPQVFASVRWWTTQPTTVVLGTAEAFPSTSGYYLLPSGAVVYIPPSVAAGAGTTVGAVGTPGITATSPHINGMAY